MLRKIEKVCTIIVFNDGTYFNGVKGKCVRKTKNFKDAKIIDREKFVGSRDYHYLTDKMYAHELIDVVYSMTVIESNEPCEGQLTIFEVEE